MRGVVLPDPDALRLSASVAVAVNVEGARRALYCGGSSMTSSASVCMMKRGGFGWYGVTPAIAALRRAADETVLRVCDGEPDVPLSRAPGDVANVDVPSRSELLRECTATPA